MLITYREAIRQALRELLKDPTVFLMGEDIGAYGGAFAVTKGFLEEYGPERVMDTPISESGLVSAAIGAGMAGAHPVVEVMTINFTLLAFDALVNHAAKIHGMSGGRVNVPLILRTVTGSGNQLGAQHSQNIEGHYAMVPGLKVLAPATPADAKGLLLSALYEPNPVFIAEHFALYNTKGEVDEERAFVPINKASVLREGTDITLIAYSRMAIICMKAAELLAQDGISAEVLDMRTLRPLDLDTIFTSIAKTHYAVMVEETGKGTSIGGSLIAEVQEQIFDELKGPIRWVAGLPVPVPYNKTLEREAIPSPDSIARAAHELLKA
ncbi:MAG: Pyruvate dehydrogenase E1 component subunit beta [bacterium ADurb.Bin429]|nr:MAG: Pyruvate dehydrogenase E1 component subunit beta [bacterium ADurb.Bin429]